MIFLTPTEIVVIGRTNRQLQEPKQPKYVSISYRETSFPPFLLFNRLQRHRRIATRYEKHSCFYGAVTYHRFHLGVASIILQDRS